MIKYTTSCQALFRVVLPTVIRLTKFRAFIDEWSEKLDIKVVNLTDTYCLVGSNPDNMALILELIEGHVSFHNGTVANYL